MSKLFLKESQINKLLELSKVNPRDNAIFEVAVSTGLRVSDLVRIKVEDVVSDSSVCPVLKIRMRKTGKIIERKLRKSCQDAIQQYLGTRGNADGFLFQSESNHVQRWTLPMNRSSIHRIYKKYLALVCKPSELKGNSCHTTRRSVAQIISKKTGGVLPASRWLGHKSLAATMSYLDADAAGLEAEAIVAGLFC